MDSIKITSTVIVKSVIAGLMVMVLTGCASMATHSLAKSISNGILNNNDPATVRAGTPAYLIMIDGLIENDPEDIELLVAGAKLYGAYAAVFVDDRERARRLTDKAFSYAQNAFCLKYGMMCGDGSIPYEKFVQEIASLASDDVSVLYVYAAAWAGKIQAQGDAWGTLADLPRVEALMERVVAVDESYEKGQAHLYLGVIRSQLPAALGGRPEIGRAHFERAIEISRGRNLIAKVEFAKTYARLVFDKELHDRLLNEVLQSVPDESGLTLSNVIAQERARVLMSGSSEYFEE